MPLWSPERWIVARHLIALVDPDAATEISTLFEKLSIEVGNMSNRTKIADLAGQLERRIESLTPIVKRHRFSNAEIYDLIDRIRRGSPTYLPADRQSAEQATLSLISLVSELDQHDRETMTDTVDQLYRLLDSLDHPDEYNRTTFATLLRNLHVGDR